MKVVLQLRNVAVSQKGRELRQHSLDVLTFLIPRFEAMLGRRVPQVVKTRLPTMRVAFTYDARPSTHYTKVGMGSSRLPARAPRVDKERRVITKRPRLSIATTLSVLDEFLRQLRAYWDQATFEVLSIANGDHSCRQINVVQRERHGFPKAQSGSIQQKQKRTKLAAPPR